MWRGGVEGQSIECQDHKRGERCSCLEEHLCFPKPVEWMVSFLERVYHPPVICEGILQLRLGKSLILPANSIKLIRLPLVLNVTAEFKGIGTLPKGIIFRGILGANQYLTFQLCNKLSHLV